MPLRRFTFAAAFPLLCLLAAPVLAQETEGERPAVLNRVLGCRGITAPDERLACFDREVAAFEAAEAARELVVVDRQQLRRTRRSLFGLSLSNLSLFGDDNDDKEKITNIETTIQSAGRDRLGKYVLVLEDGARWVQIDNQMLPLEPAAGHKIRIRRAALGSYLAKIENQVAIRVRRER